MRSKILFILTGNRGLREEVLNKALELKAFQRLSAYDDVLEVIAKQLKQKPTVFQDRSLLLKPFENPLKVEPKTLARFSGQLGMGILPKSFANKLLKTPKEALEFFLEDIAATRWGADWAAKRFADSYAYKKSGVYALNDATDDDCGSIKKLLPRSKIVVCALEVIGKSGKPVASAHPKNPDFLFQYSSAEALAQESASENPSPEAEPQDPALLFLTQLKSKFFQKA